MEKRRVEEGVGSCLSRARSGWGSARALTSPRPSQRERQPSVWGCCPRGRREQLLGREDRPQLCPPRTGSGRGAVRVLHRPSQVVSAPLLLDLSAPETPDASPRSRRVSGTGEPRGFEPSLPRYQDTPCSYAGVGNESSFSCSGNQGCLFMPFTFVPPRNLPR